MHNLSNIPQTVPFDYFCILGNDIFNQTWYSV